MQFIIRNFSDEEAKQAFREKLFRDLEGVTYQSIQVEKLLSIIERHATIDSKVQPSNDSKAYIFNLEKGQKSNRREK